MAEQSQSQRVHYLVALERGDVDDNNTIEHIFARSAQEAAETYLDGNNPMSFRDNDWEACIGSVFSIYVVPASQVTTFNVDVEEVAQTQIKVTKLGKGRL